MLFRWIAVTILFFAVFIGGVSGQSGISTRGTDFWLGFMKNNDASPSESLSLFITSPAAASGTVELPGQSWSQDFVVSPGVTTQVTIPNSLAEVLSSQSIENRGIHVFSDQPVSVYASNFETNTADATLVLPTTALGVEYMVSAYSGTTNNESELLIVATEDNSEISITPASATTSGNPAGVAFQVSLQQGECYQVKAANSGDLTGSRVTATQASGQCRPFAVFSGAGCSSVPADCFACDHLFEENFPVTVWGTEYYVAPWVFELNPDWPVTDPNYTYRILAVENGTTVNIDGVAAVNLDAGEFQEYNHEISSHCILSNKPVAVIQFMEGIECGGNGDPSMVMLEDVTKKMDEVTFATIQSSVITSHYLNVIINTSDLGSVTLDGNPISTSLFQSFPYCSGQLWCGFEISEGSHKLVSGGGGVTAYVYGNGPNESYAFSVGSHRPEPEPDFEEITCSDEDVILQLGTGYNNATWFNNSDLNNVLSTATSYAVPEPISNAIYVVKCTDIISGCEAEFYYSVESPAALSIEIPADMVLCEHQEIQLSAGVTGSNSQYQFNWTPAASLDDASSQYPVASPSETTTYQVLVSTPGQCAEAQATVTVTVNDGNIALFEANPEEGFICAGETLPLSISVESKVWSDDFDPGISWGDWEDVVNGDASSVCGSESGFGLYFNGPYPREAVTNPVDVSNGGTVYFSLKIASGSAPCDDAEPGDNVVLSYSVNNGPWANIQTLYEAAYPDFVEVAVNLPAAALSSSTRFRWRQSGTYMNNQDNWVLDNIYIGTSNTTAFNYAWTPASEVDNDQSATPVASPSASTVFEVTMTDASSGCVYSDSVQVHVGDHFSLEMSDDESVCNTDGIVIGAYPDVQGEYSYVWSPDNAITGMYGAEPTVNPTSTTTYHVEATSLEGCVATGDVVVTVSNLLELEITTTQDSLCSGETTQLDATLPGNPSGINYLWSPAAGLTDITAESPIASPAVTTNYSCTITDTATGCTTSDELEITVSESFTLSASPLSISSCSIAGLSIDVATDYNGTLTWQWSPAEMVTDAASASVTLSGVGNGELTVTATSEGGCEAQAAVQVDQQEETTDLGEDTGFCEGEGVQLDTGWPSDYTVLWSSGETSPSIIVTEAGTYSVEVTSPEGCHSADEIIVSSFSYPAVELGNDTSLCEGYELTLVAGEPGMTYQWNTGQSSRTLEVNSTGNYVATVSNGYCSSTDAIMIVFHAMPVKPFQETIEHCFLFDPVLELNAQNNGSTYLWSNDSTSKILQLNEPADLSVLVTTENNCAAIFDISVSGNCPEVLYVPNSFTPDNDGVNDVWMPVGSNILNYHVRVYNRWGELFFESSDIKIPWLGQRKDHDYYMEPGVYAYIISYQVMKENQQLSEEIKVNGQVTLVR